MSTSFPTGLDSFTNPVAGTTEGVSSRVSQSIGGRTHAQMHADVNDAIEVIQTKIGVNGSAVTTTHDYKLSGVTGTDKAVSLTGTEVLTNKTLTTPTLTTPRIADLGHIDDASGNEYIIFDSNTTAVNEFTLANAATGNNPKLSSTGGDTNIGFDFQSKGTGTYRFLGNSTQAAELRLYEDTDNGTNYTAFKVGTQSGDVTYTLPTAAPASNGFILSGTTAGVLSWVANTSIQSTSSIMLKGDFHSTGIGSTAITGNTTGFFGRVVVTAPITVQKVSLVAVNVNVAGTFKITLFAEDGQSQIFSVTTATVSGSGIVTTAVSSTAVAAGIYYLAIVPVGTADVEFRTQTISSSTTDLSNPSSEPVSAGTLTVTASTMPATFTTTALTATSTACLTARLDN